MLVSVMFMLVVLVLVNCVESAGECDVCVGGVSAGEFWWEWF